MTVIHARQALLDGVITGRVRVTLADGCIAAIEAGAAAQSGDESAGLLLPGMASLHSHGFQRGMAGLAEVPSSSNDSFWTWRETMYRFALAMTPGQLEYSQRLRDRARNVLSTDRLPTGHHLYQTALQGGARALGVPQSVIAVGAAADLVSIDIDQPPFVAAPAAHLLDAWIFASHGSVDSVWVAGRKLVEGGRHVKRHEISRNFARAMKELAAT